MLSLATREPPEQSPRWLSPARSRESLTFLPTIRRRTLFAPAFALSGAITEFRGFREGRVGSAGSTRSRWPAASVARRRWRPMAGLLGISTSGFRWTVGYGSDTGSHANSDRHPHRLTQGRGGAIRVQFILRLSALPHFASRSAQTVRSRCSSPRSDIAHHSGEVAARRAAEMPRLLGRDKGEGEGCLFAPDDPAGFAPKRRRHPEFGPQPGPGGVHDLAPGPPV